jgi:hypothetical protein
MSDDEKQECWCENLQDAARSAHLSCLQKYRDWGEPLDDTLGIELFDNVAHHYHMQWEKTLKPSADDRECTTCLQFLLKAGVKTAAFLRPERHCREPSHPLSLAAAGGCVPCIHTILDNFDGARQAVPYELWQDAVKRALSALRIDALKVLLDAVPDEYSPKLQQYAFRQACRTHRVSYDRTFRSHTECPTTVRLLLEHLIEDRDVVERSLVISRQGAGTAVGNCFEMLDTTWLYQWCAMAG